MATLDYRPSHLGICVTDLERSLRFYCDGLGFSRGESFPIGAEWGNSLEVAGEVKLTSQFVRKDLMAIELLCYDSPEPVGVPSSHRNQIGITHLSFWVDDFDAAVEHLVAHGASLLPETRAGGGMDLVFLADPDGVRIELMRAAQ